MAFTERKIDEEANEHDRTRSVEGARIDVEVVEFGSTWSVQAEAKDEGVRRVFTDGSGWIAKDRGGKRFYGEESAAEENIELMERMHAHLEELWANGPDDPDEAVKVLRDAFRATEEPRFVRERMYPQMDLTLELGAPDMKAGEVEAIARVSPNTGEVPYTYRKRKGVDDAFQRAVDGPGGIVAFLKEMASATGQRGEVSSRDFATDDPSNTHSWYYRHPEHGTVNKDLVKSRFRTAARRGGSQHEWIPCSKLITAVRNAHKHGDAARGGLWLSLAHNMRSDTADLVFKPQRKPSLDRKLKGFVDEANGSHELMRELLAINNVRVDNWKLGGHVGALYLQVGSNTTKQQTKGTQAFHAGLGKLLDDALEKGMHPADYPRVVRRYVMGATGDGSDAALWDGNLKRIVPEKFLKPVEYSPDMDSHYNDTNGQSWGPTLQAFGSACEAKFQRVIDDLMGASP